MELILIRKYFNEDYTIGKLSADGKYLCDTLEAKVRELEDINHDGDFDDSGEGKVYGKTAIPCGRYRVLFTYSLKLKRSLPILQDVYGFTGIRIHKGRLPEHTEGCIILGENKLKGQVLNSAYWETTISNLVRDSINKGDKVFITIKQ
jgi:hypothetical protein